MCQKISRQFQVLFELQFACLKCKETGEDWILKQVYWNPEFRLPQFSWHSTLSLLWCLMFSWWNLIFLSPVSTAVTYDATIRAIMVKLPDSNEVFLLNPATVRRNDRSAQSVVCTLFSWLHVIICYKSVACTLFSW